MGALAFTSGDRIGFRETPDLRLAAHEAAHTVQQHAGLSLPGNVGHVGDPWERHADHVADAVVGGQSAEPLLDQVTGPDASAQSEQGGPDDAAVQRQITSGSSRVFEPPPMPPDVPSMAPEEEAASEAPAGEPEGEADPNLVTRHPPSRLLRVVPRAKRRPTASRKAGPRKAVAKAPPLRPRRQKGAGSARPATTSNPSRRPTIRRNPHPIRRPARRAPKQASPSTRGKTGPTSVPRKQRSPRAASGPRPR